MYPYILTSAPYVTVNLVNVEQRIAFLEWQYSADPYVFVGLRLVRPKSKEGKVAGPDVQIAGEGLLLQSEMSANKTNPDALPVFSGAIALRGDGDQLLHICNG